MDPACFPLIVQIEDVPRRKGQGLKPSFAVAWFGLMAVTARGRVESKMPSLTMLALSIEAAAMFEAAPGFRFVSARKPPLPSKQFFSAWGTSRRSASSAAGNALQLSTLSLQSAYVGPARDVPGVDVLFHARAQAALFARAQTRAGGGDTMREAVLVDFGDEVFRVDDVGLCGHGVLKTLSDLR